MWNDSPTHRFYSLFPILILFLSRSSLLLTIASPSTMTTAAFRNLQRARAQAQSTSSRSSATELPKRDVNTALMGKTSPSPATMPANTTSPSGSPAHKKLRNDDETTPKKLPPKTPEQVTPSSPPPNPRPSIRWGANDTNIAEELADDGTAITTINQRRAPIFVASNTRTHTFYVKMKLPLAPNKSGPNPNATKDGRDSLKSYFQLLIQIDPTALLYKWTQSNPEETDACTIPSHLPQTLTGLRAYMQGFRLKPEGGPLWGTLRLGFNSDPADFFYNLQEEGKMLDFWSKKAPLQAAKTDYAGFLYLSQECLNPDDFALFFNAFITRLAPKYKRKPITIGCEWKAIWDDKHTKDKELSAKQRRYKKALHIVCQSGYEDAATTWTRAYLKSKTFRRLCNLPMKFLPSFKRGQGTTYNEKYSKAVEKHTKISAFGIKSTTTMDLVNIDSPCDLIEGSPTGRQLILGLKLRQQPSNSSAASPTTTTDDVNQPPNPSAESPTTTIDDVDMQAAPTDPPLNHREARRQAKQQKKAQKSKEPLPVFLSIDPSNRRGENGAYVVSYKQSTAAESEETLRFLLPYLENRYGTSAVSHWFTQDACERAEEVVWDTNADRPISPDELELDSLLDDSDEDGWFDKLDETQMKFTEVQITPVVTERPNRFQTIQSNPLEGDEETVKTFYQADDLPDLDGEEGAAGPTIDCPLRAEGSLESSAPSAV